MLGRILFILFVLSSTVAFAQTRFKGRVFENQTRIPLADILVENLSNKQSLLTDKKGMFNIAAKAGDLLRFKSFAYKTDTLLIINMQEKEIFLDPKLNELNTVNVITTQTSNLRTYYDPEFHGQTVLYHRDGKGNLDGGLVFRLWYWKKDEHKKERLKQKQQDFDTMDKIATIFTPQNLSRFVPLTGSDMSNFIGLYQPSVKTYNSNDFDLVVYLNACYKKYLALPIDKRRLDSLVIN